MADNSILGYCAVSSGDSLRTVSSGGSLLTVSSGDSLLTIWEQPVAPIRQGSSS
jgi:hypothetical protein